nr:hypothetical protein BaRGS_013020 [Batillaria attramentaria]
MAEKKGEVMLVISQLKFKDYLGDLNYASEASKFPRPIDLKKENKHRGDFDMIIIHRKYGLIISEIKAIGDSLGKLDEQEKNDKILEKVQKALSQLDKAEQVLQHLVSDLRSPKPKISKVLMLPNISRQDLKQAISCSPRINELQEHCEVVAWWGRLTSHIGEDSSMTDRIYEELVARHELLSADFPEELVRLHHFDLKEENQVDDAVEVLLKKSEESGHLCVIADEAFCGREFGEFCTKLHNNTKLCMWGASVYHGFRPDCLKEITFSKPLRTPPVITKKVMKSSLIADGYVHKYHMTNESPLPAEVADADSVRGLERKVVIWVPYDKGVGSGEMDFARLDAMSRATAQLVVID